MIHPLVLAALQENRYLVVPRLRLVRQLHIAYGLAHDETTWPTPRISVLQEWINKQLEPALREEGLMICRGTSVNLLWEEALDSLPEGAKSEIGWDIFAADEETVRQGFVRQAQLAWRLIHQYHLSWEKKDYREFPMPRFFHRWGCAYQALCRAKKVIDPTIAAVEFNRRVYEGSLVPVPSLWAGWGEDIPPLYRRAWELTQRVSETKQDLTQPVYEKRDRLSSSCLSYSDEDQELSHLALRVREWNQQHPQDSIGVVIPRLERMWHRVRRLFNQAFEVEESRQPPFDISWGETIESHPLIGDLLRLLSVTKNPRPIDSFVELFQSPYIRAAAEEQLGRHGLKGRILEISQYHTDISLPQLLREHYGREPLFSQAPRLRRALGDFLAVKGAFVAEASPHHWAEVFSRQAEALGWGAASDWTDDEVYLSGRWEKMLDSLYSLARLIPSCSRAQALAFLREETQGVYQSTRRDCRIRILGLREVEGLSFDKLFLCAMNENAITRPAANFFIPYRLGQAANLPGYSIEADWKRERNFVNRLLQVAPSMEISYALKSNEEDQLLHPSLRFQSEEPQARESFCPPQPLPLEELQDWEAPPVGKDERPRSIVTLVKNQAACPFMAFARFRLQLADPASLNDDLNASERGTMLHSLLKEIWSQLNDKKALLAMKQDKLSRLIRKEARRVLADFTKRQVLLRDDLVAELEERYLVELTEQLLEYERHSPYSFRIHGLEESKELKGFNGYDFSLKIDRIDSLNDDDQELIILDYKLRNSPFTVSVLTDERPAEPQLLIYSLLVKNCKAVGFMIASRKNGITSVGLSLKDSFSPPKWRQLSRKEFKQLQQRPGLLFRDFLRGEARVDPKNAQTCTYCAYSSLCRINA